MALRDYMLVSLGVCGRVAQITRVYSLPELDRRNIPLGKN